MKSQETPIGRCRNYLDKAQVTTSVGPITSQQWNGAATSCCTSTITYSLSHTLDVANCSADRCSADHWRYLQDCHGGSPSSWKIFFKGKQALVLLSLSLPNHSLVIWLEVILIVFYSSQHKAQHQISVYSSPLHQDDFVFFIKSFQIATEMAM